MTYSQTLTFLEKVYSHGDDHSVEPTKSLHEVVMLIVELHPSTSDFLFLQGVLGILSNVLIFEDHQARTCSPSSLFLDKDIILGEFAMAFEELDDLLHLNSKWQASDAQSPILVSLIDLPVQRHIHLLSLHTLTAISTSIEFEVVFICHGKQIDVPRPNVFAIQLILGLFEFANIREQDRGKPIVSAVCTLTLLDTLLENFEILEEVVEVLVCGCPWGSSELESYLVFLLDYIE